MEQTITDRKERRRRNGISETDNEQEGTYGNGVHSGLLKPGGLHERTDLCLPDQPKEQQEPGPFRYRRPGEIQACRDQSSRAGSRTKDRGYVKGDDGMDRKTLLDIENELINECEDYIMRGSKPKDEEMEACVKAFEAVQQYRLILQKKEQENAPGGANT